MVCVLRPCKEEGPVNRLEAAPDDKLRSKARAERRDHARSNTSAHLRRRERQHRDTNPQRIVAGHVGVVVGCVEEQLQAGNDQRRRPALEDAAGGHNHGSTFTLPKRTRTRLMT